MRCRVPFLFFGCLGVSRSAKPDDKHRTPVQKARRSLAFVRGAVLGHGKRTIRCRTARHVWARFRRAPRVVVAVFGFVMATWACHGKTSGEASSFRSANWRDAMLSKNVHNGEGERQKVVLPDQLGLGERTPRGLSSGHHFILLRTGKVRIRGTPRPYPCSSYNLLQPWHPCPSEPPARDLSFSAHTHTTHHTVTLLSLQRSQEGAASEGAPSWVVGRKVPTARGRHFLLSAKQQTTNARNGPTRQAGTPATLALPSWKLALPWADRCNLLVQARAVSSLQFAVYRIRKRYVVLLRNGFERPVSCFRCFGVEGVFLTPQWTPW